LKEVDLEEAEAEIVVVEAVVEAVIVDVEAAVEEEVASVEDPVSLSLKLLSFLTDMKEFSLPKEKKIYL
jgi:hypothetical protein